MTRPPRSEWPSVLAGAIIIVAGITAAIVETYRVRWGLWRGTVWIVAAVTAVVVVAVRLMSRRRL